LNLPIKSTEAGIIDTFLAASNGVPAYERYAQSRNSLQLMGEVFQRVNEAELAARLYLGRILLTVKNEQLWKGLNSDTWQTFINERLPEAFGISTRLGYEAMEMAGSETLTALAPEQLGKIPISNAKALVRVEKSEGKPTAEVISNAQTMPPGEFRASVSVKTGALVQKWVKDPAVAPHIRRMLDVLAGLSEDAAQHFADLLESPDLIKRAGDGPDNRVDLILAAVAAEFQGEQAEEDDIPEDAFQSAGGVFEISALSSSPPND